jgi:hypothetical protein
MGISFLYIGRDENTLKDKLLIETPTGSGLPQEMNTTTSFFGGARGNTSTSAFNASSILSRYPPGLIPTGFNFSSPYVEAPFPPIQIPRRPLNLTALIPWLPADVFKLPDSTVSELEDLLKSRMPGIPKDFKFSKLYSPGGMVISELEGLMSGIRKGMGFKDPMGETFGGADHHSLGRSVAEA